MRSRSMNSIGVTANFGNAASVMLSTICAVHEEALLAAVLGDEGDAVSDALPRRMTRQRPVADDDLAGLVASSPKRMRASSVRPEPIRPKTPSTSPRAG